MHVHENDSEATHQTYFPERSEYRLKLYIIALTLPSGTEFIPFSSLRPPNASHQHHLPRNQPPTADSMETREQRRQRHEREQNERINRIAVQEMLRWVALHSICGHRIPRPIHVDVVADLRRPSEEVKASDVLQSRIEWDVKRVTVTQERPQQQQQGHQQPSTGEDQQQQGYQHPGLQDGDEQPQGSGGATREQLDEIGAALTELARQYGEEEEDEDEQ